MEIKLKTGLATKSYLKNFTFFEFDNLVHFLFEFFSVNTISNKDIEDTIYKRILNLGYDNVNQIPSKIKLKLETKYTNRLNQSQIDFDIEKHTYLFIAKVISKDVLITIDNTLIKNLESKIHLKPDSTISFTEVPKMDNIQFTTL